MNHLLNLHSLSNQYFIMRHGHSLANLERIIVGHPGNGLNNYGLSAVGRSQVHAVAESNKHLNQETVIISSDFKRARESAEIIHQTYRCQSPISYDIRLRERNFGELESGPDSGYALVWREDKLNGDNRLRGVESPNQVMERVTGLICEYEERLSASSVLLVSHGDALQILQTAFMKQDASQHRQQQHLETAEIKALALSAN